MVDSLGIGQAVQQMLDGTFEIPEGLDEYAKKLIPHFQMEDVVRNAMAKLPMSNRWGIQEFKSGWRKSKERTSAGKSGHHFGLQKACMSHPELAEFECAYASVPYETGYSPEEWQHGVQAMLEKKKGDINVEKLRAILLYESVFNHNNKKLGRDMMYHAEELKQIAVE